MESNWNFKASSAKEDAYASIIPKLQELTKDYKSKTAEEQDMILDQVIQEIRTINVFPVFYFNEDGISQEIQDMINHTAYFMDDELVTQLRYGLLLLDFLFPNLHDATTCNVSKSMKERFFNDDTLKYCLKKFFIQYDTISNLRTTFFSVSRYFFDTPINFSPIRAKAIYERFCPPGGLVYDYSCGYGGRMLGCLSSKNNFTYIGTDPNSETYKNLKILGQYIEKETGRTKSYQIYNLPSQDFILKNNSVDFCFSCPPYFNKEIYCNEETQSINTFPNYYDWLEGYVRVTIRNCYKALKTNGIFAFDVGNYFLNGKKINLTEDWKRIAEEEGFYFKQAFKIGSRFRKKETEDTEQILVFTKDQYMDLPDYSDNAAASAFKKHKMSNEEKYYRRNHVYVAEYDIFGELQNVYFNYKGIEDIPLTVLKSKKLQDGNKYYRIYRGTEPVLQTIDIKKPICIIDGQYFFSFTKAGEYIGVSKQAMSQGKKRNQTIFMGKEVKWLS